MLEGSLSKNEVPHAPQIFQYAPTHTHTHTLKLCQELSEFLDSHVKENISTQNI